MHAIISDIHGNQAALEAVLADIEARGIKRIICLGDVVGYGPNPSECVDLVRKNCEIVVCGNHDVAVLTQAFGFNKYARDAIDWTRDQIKPTKVSLWQKRGRWDFLRNLPDRYQEGRVLYVHGSPRDPVMEYMEESDTVDMGFGPSEKIRDIFGYVDWLCFVGHSHLPGIFTGDFRYIHTDKLEDGAYEVPENGKAVVNVGSVGQPRDGDSRSCYATLDGGIVKYHRVTYDIQRTIAEMGKHTQLDERLARRLASAR